MRTICKYCQGTVHGFCDGTASPDGGLSQTACACSVSGHEPAEEA